MGYYPPRVLIADARRFGVKVLPLDINRSINRYTVENGEIRISLQQLKGISDIAIKAILSERTKGEFTSLDDFTSRVSVGRPILENLIRAGAFDSFGSRPELLMELRGLLRIKRRMNKGTKYFFNEAEIKPVSIVNPADNRKTMMLDEMELLSMDLSAHPLDFYPLDNTFTRIKDLPSVTTGKLVKLIGSVIRYQTPPTRNGNRVVYIIMEDGTGVADVTVFNDIQEKCGQVLFREDWLIVKGKVQRRGPKALSIIAQDLAKVR